MAVALPPIDPLSLETANQGSEFQLDGIKMARGRSQRRPCKADDNLHFLSEHCVENENQNAPPKPTTAPARPKSQGYGIEIEHECLMSPQRF
jgi:hypothetical protein